MKYKQWNLAAPCPEGAQVLYDAGLPPLLATVLSARGVAAGEEACRLLDPASHPMHDPMLLRDMDKAVARIRQAISNKELMAVYGDYDVDGITSTCLLTEFFRSRGGKVLPYIPDRLEEGYGLNYEAIDYLSTQHVSLIVTVDCGITAVDEVAYAREKGIEVVITDHHACKETLPPAVAVVDPHHPGCPYPFKGLAGVGVALKLAMAVAEPEAREEVFDSCCDLAAIGTVADVMPMVGENRTIVQKGLSALARPGRVGLSMLVQEAGLDNRPLNSVSIGYALSPRLNAAGRMGQAGTAVELLLARDRERARELAQELCRLNRERQSVEADIFAQCEKMLADVPQKNAIVLAAPHWHQGVVGIVASRLAEQHGCPAFMICLSGGMGKGSCRSYGGINLFDLLEGCEDLLEAFGGHELAAGFTVREENVLALAQRIRAQVAAQAAQVREPELEVDVQLEEPAVLDLRGVQLLDRLEPYGTGNPRPVFCLMGAQVMARSVVGAGRHLKLKLSKRGMTLDAIFFSAGDVLPEAGSRVDVAFCPQINEYRGNRTVQLHVVDLRPTPSRARLERELLEKYRRQDNLTVEEARRLLPQRETFAGLWRWLRQKGAEQAPVEVVPAQLAQTLGGREQTLHLQVCLDVMCERGLLRLDGSFDRPQVTLLSVQGKVDLEASPLMLRLRQQGQLPV